jgi:hypothetical protein
LRCGTQRLTAASDHSLVTSIARWFCERHVGIGPHGLANGTPSIARLGDQEAGPTVGHARSGTYHRLAVVIDTPNGAGRPLLPLCGDDPETGSRAAQYPLRPRGVQIKRQRHRDRRRGITEYAFDAICDKRRISSPTRPPNPVGSQQRRPGLREIMTIEDRALSSCRPFGKLMTGTVP